MKQFQIMAALGVLVWASATFAMPVVAHDDYGNNNDVSQRDVISSIAREMSSPEAPRTDGHVDFGIYSNLSGNADDFFGDETEAQFNIVNVSEPGAWALLVLGVIGLILARRKTRE